MACWDKLKATKAEEQDVAMKEVSEAIRIGTIELKSAREKVEQNMTAQIEKMEKADEELRKQVEMLKGALVMTAQEKPEGLRKSFIFQCFRNVFVIFR